MSLRKAISGRPTEAAPEASKKPEEKPASEVKENKVVISANTTANATQPVAVPSP